MDFVSDADECVLWSEGVSISVWTDLDWGDSVWVDWSRVDPADV